MGSKLFCSLFLLLGAAGLSAQVVPGRFLVEFEGEPGIRRSRQAVRQDQSRARVWLRLEGAVERLSLDTIANAISVETDEAGADRLRRIPGVKRVQPVFEYRMTLDHALPLLGAPEAWELAGPYPGEGVKIAIIDSGIDISHPGFEDGSMSAPDGYPQVSSEREREFTNSKVIVARSYVDLLRRPDPDPSARDRIGHGTAAAMVAAGVAHDGPFGRISGVAPKSWLGSYKVFGSAGVNESTTSDIILKAVEDAVLDGMNVINLSLGSSPAPVPEADIERDAIDRASERGVVVVASSGNEGPDLTTISSPASIRSALAVGATYNGRRFATKLDIDGHDPVAATPGNGVNPPAVVEGILADIGPIDESGLACSALPADSLSGRIALVLRGECNFSQKIANARQAGAVAVVVFASEERPEIVTMDVAGEPLPASMISLEDGLSVRAFLAEHPDTAARLHFTRGPLTQRADRLAAFTGKGPAPDLAIKPDLVTTGTDLLTAGQRVAPEGSLYSASGYLVVAGTSFSAPLAAGAAAVLRAARPGLTSQEYRSLLIGQTAALGSPLQEAGAGLLRLDRAIPGELVAEPPTVSLGAGSGSIDHAVAVLLKNLSTESGEFDVAVDLTREGLAVSAPETISLGAGEATSLVLTLNGSDLPPGAYEGVVRLTNTVTERVTRIPFWYAVRGDKAESVAILSVTASGRAGTTLTNAVLFRFLDAGGIPIEGVEPEVSVVSGNGMYLRYANFGSLYPGLFSLTVRPAAGPTVFRLQLGDAFRDVTITGQ